MDLEKLCRTCLQSGGKLYSLFDSQIDEFDLHQTAPIELLRLFTSIRISDEDKHPGQICTICLLEIERICNFRLECEKSESILKQLKSVKQEPANADFDFSAGSNADPNLALTKKLTEIKDEPPDNYQLCESQSANISQTVKEEPDLNMLTDDIEEVRYSDEEEKFALADLAILRRLQCNACKHDFAARKCFQVHITYKHMNGLFCQLCNEDVGGNNLKHYSKHLTVTYTLEQYPDIVRCGICHCLPIAHKLQNCPKEGSSHPSLKCYSCSTDLQKNDVIIRKADNSDTIHCDSCLKNYTTINELFEHIHKHVTLDDFTCEFCSKIFIRRRSLKLHLEGPWRCAHCSKRFCQRHLLISHTTKEHPADRNTKRYKCQFCSKTFWYSTGYKSHLKMHSRKKVT